MASSCGRELDNEFLYSIAYGQDGHHWKGLWVANSGLSTTESSNMRCSISTQMAEYKLHEVIHSRYAIDFSVLSYRCFNTDNHGNDIDGI